MQRPRALPNKPTPVHNQSWPRSLVLTWPKGNCAAPTSGSASPFRPRRRARRARGVPSCAPSRWSAAKFRPQYLDEAKGQGMGSRVWGSPYPCPEHGMRAGVPVIESETAAALPFERQRRTGAGSRQDGAKSTLPRRGSRQLPLGHLRPQIEGGAALAQEGATWARRNPSAPWDWWQQRRADGSAGFASRQSTLELGKALVCFVKRTISMACTATRMASRKSTHPAP
eukprot:scaffold27105_cov32-Tisochrysis_lutea.AAC.4